jgi:hypothetical protein
LIAAIVAVEIAQRHLDEPFGWLTMPYRHLPDLYAKLGVGGPIESRLASLWSACFRAANVLGIAACALPALAVILIFASDTLGRDRIPGWQSSGLGPAQLGVALLVGSLVVCTAGSVGLLVPITLGLVRRQRTRRTLVRVGRSRSWVARPGEGGYTPAQPTSLLDDPLDRVIEHYPRFDTSGDPALEPGWGLAYRSDQDQGYDPIGGQGAGGIGGRGFGPVGGQSAESPDQASLNSPSTTSSFPWSDEPASPED